MARGRKSPKLTNDESSDDIDRNKVETDGFATVDTRIDGIGDSSGDQTFVVKMISNHKVDKAGNASNLSISGDQILNEYYATIGGRDVIFKKPGRIPRAKRARQRSTKMMTPNYTSTEQWSPPSGSWEEHIKRIDYCVEEEEN
ncbi:Chromo domain-containing protein [Fusarium sp. Ph1]|nr:Chromo domain-containing protein [Fusarium sp. Ph1]